MKYRISCTDFKKTIECTTNLSYQQLKNLLVKELPQLDRGFDGFEYQEDGDFIRVDNEQDYQNMLPCLSSNTTLQISFRWDFSDINKRISIQHSLSSNLSSKQSEKHSKILTKTQSKSQSILKDLEKSLEKEEKKVIQQVININNSAEQSIKLLTKCKAQQNNPYQNDRKSTSNFFKSNQNELKKQKGEDTELIQKSQKLIRSYEAFQSQQLKDTDKISQIMFNNEASYQMGQKVQSTINEYFQQEPSSRQRHECHKKLDNKNIQTKIDQNFDSNSSKQLLKEQSKQVSKKEDQQHNKRRNMIKYQDANQNQYLGTSSDQKPVQSEEKNQQSFCKNIFHSEKTSKQILQNSEHTKYKQKEQNGQIIRLKQQPKYQCLFCLTFSSNIMQILGYSNIKICDDCEHKWEIRHKTRRMGSKLEKINSHCRQILKSKQQKSCFCSFCNSNLVISYYPALPEIKFCEKCILCYQIVPRLLIQYDD